MKNRFRLAGVCLLAIAFLATAPQASAQTHQCGDIQLVFRNPDLQPGQDGIIRAQGRFFAQFQAIGADADKIKIFGFSFSPAGQTDFDESACDLPIWLTGAYLQNYRADRDPTDGFFIPLVTMLVPDGQYNAAVHGYDEGGNEIARFWAKAIVDNCNGGDASKCDDAPDEWPAQDKTAPWPMILPGDGQALEGHTFTIEFGEEIANYTVHLNGEDITANMTEWDGRIWDADYEPDYGPGGAGETAAPPCSGAPGQKCEKYGPAYEWTERALTDSDVIRVEAYDIAGNRAVKDIHIGSSVSGGAVTADVPILGYSVDQTEFQVGAGGSATYQFTIVNNGAADGHPFAEATVPANWTYEWQPVHVVVPAGGTAEQELIVTAPLGVVNGIYKAEATLVYASGTEEKRLVQELTILVGEGGPVMTGLPTDTASSSEDTPAWIWSAVLAAFGAAFVRRR